MARKPFLLLGTPNSGTDWLAACIVKATGWRYFTKEFFNPITNPAHAGELLRAFGCEMLTGIENVGRCDAARTAEVIERTWPAGTYDFNKEVYSFAKLPVLVNYFNCVALTRSTASLFPPSRLRVWQWYDAIWHSLKAAGYVGLHGVTPHDRAVEAHECANDIIFRDTIDLALPQISYDHLMRAPGEEIRRVCASLAAVWPLDPEKLTAEILATRRGKKMLEPPAPAA